MNNLKFKPLLLLIAIIPVLLFTNTTSNADWKTITTNDGLAHNEVYSLAIDTMGYIWAGTKGGGISIFDGEGNWHKNYTTANSGLPHNNVYSIQVDTSGHVWLGTGGGGVCEYNGNTWSTAYTAQSTNGGLTGDYIYSIAVDTSNNMWFATKTAGASKHDPTINPVSFSSYTIYNYQDKLVSNNLRAIDIAPNGSIWFATYDNGVINYNENSGKWTTYTHSNTSNGLSSNIILTLTLDNNGILWAGTSTKGVSVFNNTQQQWTSYTTSNSGLSNDSIRTIAIDNTSRGGVWIGTNGSGVCKFDKDTSWTTFNDENSGLPNNFVYAIAVSEITGYRWFGTLEGIALFIEKDIEVEKSKVLIRGGVEGYVNPDIGETAAVYFNASEPGRVTVKIFTINGNLVWKTSEHTDGNQDSIVWDCKNNATEIISSGIYLIHIEAPGIEELKKIAILR